MESNKDREIALVNRGKIAYLYTEGIFEDRIEKILRNGMEQWAFVFKYTESLKELLKEYDYNNFLKLYNSSFKNIALAIKKKQMQEI